MQYLSCSILFFLISAVAVPARAQAVFDLESIINRALAAGWGMIDARENVERARLRIDIAESAFELKIYPGAIVGLTGGDDQDTQTDLGLSVSLEKKTAWGTAFGVSPSVTTTDDQYQNLTNFRIVQPLLRGLGRDYNLSGVYSARFAERTARRAEYQQETATVVNAVRYGYEVVRQRETLRLREESFTRLDKLEQATVIKQGMGLVDAMDLYRVRIQRNQAEEERNQSRQAYDDALDALKIFLALPVKEDITVALPLAFDRVNPDPQQMIDTALSNRVELAQVRDELTEARRLSGIARQDTLPELDIGLSMNVAGDPTDDFPGDSPDQTTWSISLGSSTDFRRTAEKAVFQTSLLNVQQTARKQQIIRDEIVAEVKRVVRSLEREDKAIVNQEDQIRQARGQLELARVKFEHGMADNFDLIDAEIALRQAETRLVSAVIEYIIGQYRLRQAVGTLVQSPQARSWQATDAEATE